MDTDKTDRRRRQAATAEVGPTPICRPDRASQALGPPISIGDLAAEETRSAAAGLPEQDLPEDTTEAVAEGRSRSAMRDRNAVRLAPTSPGVYAC